MPEEATQPNDTPQKALKAQLPLLCKARGAQRVARVHPLSATVSQVAKRALRRTHPEPTPRQLDVFFVERSDGPELAQRLREARRRAEFQHRRGDRGTLT